MGTIKGLLPYYNWNETIYSEGIFHVSSSIKAYNGWQTIAKNDLINGYFGF